MLDKSKTLDNARNFSGLTWAAIARAMGISPQTLHNWRAMKTRIPEHKWQALAAAMAPATIDRAEYLREWAESRQKSPQDAASVADAPPPPKTPDAPTAAQNGPSEGIGGWFAGLLTDE